MADIQKGHSFSSGDLVTAGKLNNLVDDASIVDITEAAFAVGSHIITSSSSAPSPATAGHVWWDTSTAEADGQGILKVHDGTRWQSVSKNIEQYYINRSDATLTYGDVVILDISEDRSVTTTTTEASTAFFGIVASAEDGSSSVLNASNGRVVRSGLAVVNIKAGETVTRGDYLGTSDTVKLAKSLGASPTTGAFGRAVENTATDKWLVALSNENLNVPSTVTPVLVGAKSTTATNRTLADAPGTTVVSTINVTPVVAGPFVLKVEGYIHGIENQRRCTLEIREGSSVLHTFISSYQLSTVFGAVVPMVKELFVANSDTATRTFTINGNRTDGTSIENLTLDMRVESSALQWTVS